MKKRACAIWFALICFAVWAGAVEAGVIYPLEIFTGSGGPGGPYSDLNLSVEVVTNGTSTVDFIFRNESSIDSSVAGIYFDDSSESCLWGIAEIIEGGGTSFSYKTTPHNLPGANLLNPVFETTEGFSIGGEAPPPKDGVNPGEYVTISFNLASGRGVEDVISQLDTDDLRIGAHVIGLPGGFGGSAIDIPEPGMLMLAGTFGFGLWISNRKKRRERGVLEKAPERLFCVLW